MSHTPGPWAAWHDTCRKCREDGTQEWEVDGPPVGYHARFTSEADASLIAAAPELLEALTDMLAGWKYIRSFHGDLYGVGWDRAEGKAVNAIAKALGTSPEVDRTSNGGATARTASQPKEA